MKITNTEVMNFDGAFRGLRNPLQSWKKSDSIFGIYPTDDDFPVDQVIYDWILYDNALRIKCHQPIIEEDSEEEKQTFEKYSEWLYKECVLNYSINGECADIAIIGPNDFDLARRMIKAGSSDRKFLRQIMVSVDITAPLYWWKQFDTYKVGTVANSTSTMHKLASTPITIDCFETDDMEEDLMFYFKEPYSPDMYIGEYWAMLITDLEHLRKKYNETKDQRYWKELIRLLPEGWLQTRTVTLNYEVLRTIYSQRKNHRLSEWHVFCDWIKTLPYAESFITYLLD